MFRRTGQPMQARFLMVADPKKAPTFGGERR